MWQEICIVSKYVVVDFHEFHNLKFVNLHWWSYRPCQSVRLTVIWPNLIYRMRHQSISGWGFLALKGSFNNYVDQILLSLTTYPPQVDNSQACCKRGGRGGGRTPPLPRFWQNRRRRQAAAARRITTCPPWFSDLATSLILTHIHDVTKHGFYWPPFLVHVVIEWPLKGLISPAYNKRKNNVHCTHRVLYPICTLHSFMQRKQSESVCSDFIHLVFQNWTIDY